jgi:plastocyanin
MRKQLGDRFWLRAAVAMVALLVALVGPGLSSQQVSAQDSAVTIEGFAFAPASITITAGSTVTWTNNDAAPHTATGDGGEFDTGQIDQGGNASVTFDTPGTYTYHCTFHPNMTGTIVVEAAGGDDGTDDGDGTTELPDTGAGIWSTDNTSAAGLFGIAALAIAAASAGFALRRRGA